MGVSISAGRYNWLSQNLTGRIYWLSPNSASRFDVKFSISAMQIYWLSPNLLADFADFHQICWQIWWHSPNFCQHKWRETCIVTKSASRFADIWLNLLTEMWGQSMFPLISAGRLTDFHKIDWPNYWLSPNLPAEILTPTFLSADLVNSANLSSDLLTVSKSAGRFGDNTCFPSFLLPHLVNVTISASRFGDSQ